MPEDLFFIDNNISAPEPFDRGVANLSVQTEANSHESGMELTVTAGFGNDFVQIELSDGSKLEVNCSIYQALIVASTFHCNLVDRTDQLRGGGYSFRQKYQQDEDVLSSNAQDFKASGDLAATEIRLPVGLGGSKQLTRRSENLSQVRLVGERQSEQVEIGNDQIRIHANPDKSPLVGNLVDHAKCFFVSPSSPKTSFGVLLRLQISRSWMKLTDPKPIGATERFMSLFSKVFSGDQPEDEYHRRAFILLLEHLVHTGLQSEEEDKYATMAACALRTMPTNSGEFEHRFAQLAPRKLILPVNQLETVLIGEPVTTYQTLLTSGVAEALVEEISIQELFFDPKDGHYNGEQVGFFEFLSKHYEVIVGSSYFTGVIEPSDIEVNVPLDFALEYVDDGISSPRSPSSTIEVDILSDGLATVFSGSNGKLLTCRRRGDITTK